MSVNTAQAFKDIQAAAYDLLAGEISVPIYDEVPKSPPANYVTFGDMASSAFEARDVAGRSVTFIFNIWTRKQGGKFKAYEIMTEIINKMNAGKLSMENFAEVQKTVGPCMVERLDEEPGSFQAVLPFLFLVVEK
jgi:hypothetical protein